MFRLGDSGKHYLHEWVYMGQIYDVRQDGSCCSYPREDLSYRAGESRRVTHHGYAEIQQLGQVRKYQKVWRRREIDLIIADEAV
jgi:hypothetical protein